MMLRRNALSVLVVVGLLAACGAEEPGASESGSQTKNKARPTSATTVAPVGSKPLVVKALPGNKCAQPAEYYYETSGKDAGSCVLSMAQVTPAEPCPSGYGADFVSKGIRYCFRLAANVASAQTTVAATTTTVAPTTTVPPPTTLPPTTTVARTPTTVKPAATTTTSTLSVASIAATGVKCTPTACRIGDTGPNGGFVFITPSTPGNTSGLFFEAPVARAWYNATFGCGDTAFPDAGAAIGDGLKNTAQIVYLCGSSSTFGRLSGIALNDPKKNMFLPSSGELAELAKYFSVVKGDSPFSYGEFWSSTPKGNVQLVSDRAGRLDTRERGLTFDYTLIWAFRPDLSPAVVVDDTRTYRVGDIGPAGGYVFLTPSTPGNATGKYFEVARSDWSGTEIGDQLGTKMVVNNTQVAWSCPDYIKTSLPGTLTAIGTGQENTRIINEQCASYDGPMKFATREAVNYRGAGRDDWFVPSKDELFKILVEDRKTIPKMVHDSPSGSYSIKCMWSSSEASPTVGWGGNQFMSGAEMFATVKNISTNCVVPVRMFEATEPRGKRS